MKLSDYLIMIRDFISLENEKDSFERIDESIRRDVIFKGTNLWILAFAIIIASVGLNMNSTAVIIGAMLISPLMGPINGMGYGLATYDFSLFRLAAKNYSFAVIAGLLASTCYFLISPISTAHSELLARTTPTIYDVLIALFGGLAGIVAISSRLKGNVIPGVAIATALMPPLCTSGYGLASGKADYFFGAFYLFTINTVFIAISSVLISRILNFPVLTVVDPVRRKKIKRWISVTIVILIIPSVFFGYKLVRQERFTENARRLISECISIDGHYLLKYEISEKTSSIDLIYTGDEISDDQKQLIYDKVNRFSLGNANIKIYQSQSDISGSATTEELIRLQREIEKLRLEIEQIKKFHGDGQ